MKFPRWLVICIAWLSITAVPVAANGSPIKIFLSYLPEYSNYGPIDANGVALVSIGEAWVELTADGLPALKDALYEAWLVNADTQEMVSLGTFNADVNGHVAYSAELDELPVANYRYFVISVEPSPDPSPEADKRWTIAGVFPNPELVVVSGTPTPTPPQGGPTGEPGITPSPAAPAVLPVTGGEAHAGVGATLVVALFLLALGLGAGLVGSQRKSRSNS